MLGPGSEATLQGNTLPRIADKFTATRFVFQPVTGNRDAHKTV